MKKVLTIVLCVSVFLMLFVTSTFAEAPASEMTTLDIAQGSIIISASGASGGGLMEAESALNPAGYVITQSGSGAVPNTITVNSGVSVVITLSNVNIVSSSNAAFKIADNSLGNVTLIIADNSVNVLQSGNGHAGIEKNGGTTSGTLTITSGLLGNGILNARGAPGSISPQVYGGAGIGGARFNSTANIVINDAVVNAVGGHWAAGLGGGLSGAGSNISIIGSTIRAVAGTEGAGIGGGSSAAGSNIIISGSSVYAAAGWAGNNIGGGRNRSSIIVTSDGTTPVYRTDVSLFEVAQPVPEVKAVKNINVEGLSSYYTDKTLYTTNSGTLYLWLPVNSTVKSLTAEGFSYTGSVDSATAGFLTLTLNLGNGIIKIYPDRFMQNNVTYPYIGKYIITGSYTADTPLAIINDTDTPVYYDITLDNATINARIWCTAVRIDNKSPSQSHNPENLIVDLTISGTVSARGSNHPGLQADSRSIVNLKGLDGSSFFSNQVYGGNAVSRNISLNVDGVCTVVEVNHQPADISAAYTQKPLLVTFFDEHVPGEWIVNTEATCTAAGSRHIECTLCGKVLITEIMPAIGHTPGGEATCTEPQLCTICGEELVPAAGHTPGGESTCTEPQLCTICGEELAPAAGHTPGGEATCTEPQLCIVCGEELVPAAGHGYSNGACSRCGEDDPGFIENPKTGKIDKMTYLILILVTVAATLFYTIRRKTNAI